MMHKKRRSSSLPSPSLLLLLVLAPPRWIAAAETPFIQYPTDVNAALGTNVTLECVANQPVLAWAVNDVQLLDQTVITDFIAGGVVLELGETERDGDYNRTTITIPASEFVNETIDGIVCQAGQSQFNLDSGPTFNFSVYGLPLSPGQLEVRGGTAHQLTLTWSPPFTLPGETVHYSLVIEDQVTGQPETVAPLTDTGYTHTVSESEALDCHPFLFSVFSVNDVGLSINSSSAPPAVHPSAPGPVGAVQSKVVHDSQAQAGSQATVNLLFQSPASCFNLTYNVSLYDEIADIQTTVSPPVSTADDAVTLHIAGLRENTRYTATVTAYNNFQFSIDSPVHSDQVSFVTSGVQSVAVLQYGNQTLRITCTFAEGTSSLGCKVTLTVDTVTSTIIELNRNEDALEIVHYDTSMGGAPSSVQVQELGVADAPIISGSVVSEEGPTPPDMTSSVTTPTTSTASPTTTESARSPATTPTARSTESTSSSGLNILTWAIPAGVGVAVLMLLVLFGCCLVCCRLRSSKYHMNRRDTLPHGLHLPSSPSSPAYSHDYKQVPPHVTGTIKEMSFNPLYGDAPAKTFDPPLPSLPQSSNGGTFSPRDTITLHSDLPPVYEEVSVKAAKLAANPQYGAVGGANGATPNPQYSSTEQLDKPARAEEHMYASLKEPGALSTQQKLSSQYARPYEHVQSSHAPPPEGVVITTDSNVSYSVSPSSSAVSPQKSL